MDEKKIKAYFKEQSHLIIQRSASDPEGFLAYFASREPKDEEILGLLAVSTMMGGDFPVSESFPTALEALSALSSPGRLEICREFRKELKNYLRQTTAA